MNASLWSAVGQVGDDLIADAAEEQVRTYFRRKKRRRLIRFGSAAACFLLMLGTLTAVSVLMNGKTANTEDRSIGKQQEVLYPHISLRGDWAQYDTAKELTDAATEVYAGTVTDISFAIVDQVTGKADPSPDSDSTHRMLYTLYTVAVSDSYKGDPVREKVICVIGGLAGYREEEQAALLASAGLAVNGGIPILTDPCSFRLGQAYLFCTVRLGGDYDHILNPSQTAYPLSSANAQQIIRLMK